ncbi:MULTISPECIES: cobalamin biosynthesis protein CobG [Streptomyces]|uniref:cobalamin biosynthesis protein CobG n=1 Tax=Streptomyces TaxID=1883 RepID=UPI00163CF389|nr:MULTISPECIES: cobalamin biosynthesis protein CobG [Streptomyces]MBC2876185.1 cobalamin biosynthesis protein CobG [Streptomyces sp. TYQ1024]UBI35588.1 cobalamin biosynthesis protein CobG [Streptomyces mobaraensis]UKW28183.1 cobalamin biosynthesis protein CobG [Streptomyces sp. TYQ1024]
MLAAMPVTPTPPGSDRPRARGDACPGALRLHAADDGALARVRLPAGLLTVRQAMELATLAVELGDGNLDLTSRGNIQLRALPAGSGGELGGRLRATGLLPSDRHERVRNIAASPLHGLDGTGHADVGAWARELDRLLCADDEVTALSGRFLFGLDDGRGDIAALTPDVTLIAEPDGRTAVLCYAAEGPGLRVPAADAPRAAVVAARHFLAAHGGSAWRVTELPAGRRPDVTALAARLADAEVTAVPTGRSAAPPPGPVSGPDGRTALSVAAPLGRLTAGQWRLLVAAAEAGSGELRVTPWRGVVVPGLADADAAAARLAGLADAGLVVSAASPWYGAGACAGRPGCAKSRADVRADATAALTGTRPGGTGDLPVYWSGCERRCGHPGGRWVDVLATDDGYRVAVRTGGGDAEQGVRRVTAAGLPGAVAAARSGPDGDGTP